MQNLNFISIGNQTWSIESVHTGLVIGNIFWNRPWNAFAFRPDGWCLDATAIREIAAFLDEQESLRGQQ